MANERLLLQDNGEVVQQAVLQAIELPPLQKQWVRPSLLAIDIGKCSCELQS